MNFIQSNNFLKRFILNPTNNYYERIMLLLTFGYAFFVLSFPSIGKIMFIFLLLGSLPLFKTYKNKIFKEPVIILFILVIVAQILSWINSLIHRPDLADLLPHLDRGVKLLVFFFIAYWLKGNIRNVLIIWFCFIFGFFVGVLNNNSFELLLSYFDTGSRADLSFKNAQFDSMLSGTGFLLTLFSIYYLFSSKLSKHIKIILYLLIFTLIVFFLYIIFITQSRQVWLGLIVVLVFLPILYMLLYKVKSFKFLITSLILIIGIIFFLGNSDIIKNRVFKEKNVLYDLFYTNKPIPMTSIGIRLNSWLDAKEWIVKHPLIGLDTNAIAAVIDESERFNDNLKESFGHLHNFYIEVLVSYGVFGLSLFFAMYYFVITSTQKNLLEKDEKKYILFISICFVIYWFVINNFETFSSRSLGIFTQNIVFGSLYTFYINHSLRKNKK